MEMSAMMSKVLEFAGARLKERSTWLGIITVLTLLGVRLTPELKEAIITTGVSVGSLVAILTKG